MEAQETKSLYCEYNHRNTGSYFILLGNCPAVCDKFPCEKISDWEYHALHNSPNMSKIFTGFKGVKRKMYMFLKEDGNICPAYQGFDFANPDFEKMKDVKEVYYVAKVYKPQYKLVLKTKEERQQQPKKSKKTS